MPNSYSYMNDDAIDDELKCIICHLPFNEPFSSTRCHHTFCKDCIIPWINREKQCPVCRTHLEYTYYFQPVRSYPLLNQLNRLLVCCDACQHRNIERGNFQAHTQTCPNWVVPCSAVDIRCGWQGPRNQLAQHVRNCPFQHIRPIVDDLRGQIQSHSREISDLQWKLSFLFAVVFAIFFIWILSIGEQNRKPRNFIEKLHGLFE